MKAEELMIGDWVYINNKPVDVDEICIGYNYDFLEPIPITDIMLKNNGFVEKNDKFSIKFKERDSIIIIEYGYQRLVIQKTNPVSSVNVVCMYVHELQHILRSCGINKEIEL